MRNITEELKRAKGEVEKGGVPKQLAELLDEAVTLIEDLQNMQHIRVRFEDEELSMQEVIERYKHYRYGKE